MRAFRRVENLWPGRSGTSRGGRHALRSVRGMSRNRIALSLLAVVAAVLGFTAPSLSGATVTSRSTATGTVQAAADWTPPSVSMANPGSPISGTVSITANATDGQTGIAKVEIQYLAPNSSSWATLCVVTASPYTCSWNTKNGVDGQYSLLAIATDNAGYTTTSDPVSTTVANNLLVVLGDPGDFVKGSVTMTATLYNAAPLTTYTVKIEYTTAGSTTGWKSLCTPLGTSNTYSCTWLTGTFTNGTSYDLRASATANGTTTTSVTVFDTMVDNQAPTVTMTDPGTPLSGTITLAATASDAESGIASVAIQYQSTALLSSWTTACTLTSFPYSCRFDTTQLALGTYNVRAVATDAIANSTTSATVTNRKVDNSVDSVTMEDPGAYLTGTVTLTSNASSTAGVTSVTIQRAPAGTTTWTTVCSITSGTSPYTCGWDSTTVADGLYDFRSVLVSGAGKTTTSTTMANRRVDNTTLRGYDVQTVNGGANVGKLEVGDTLTYTYTDTIKTSTVTAGWTGAAIAVQVRLRDGGSLGLSSKDDTVDVMVGGSVISLGTIDLKDDYIKGGKTATFNATMTHSTVSAGATTRSVITIKLGTLASGGGLRTAGAAKNMVWTPSAGVTDNYATTCSTAPTTETGTLDKDF